MHARCNDKSLVVKVWRVCEGPREDAISRRLILARFRLPVPDPAWIPHHLHR